MTMSGIFCATEERQAHPLFCFWYEVYKLEAHEQMWHPSKETQASICKWSHCFCYQTNCEQGNNAYSFWFNSFLGGKQELVDPYEHWYMSIPSLH